MARITKEAWAKPTLKTKEVEVEELGGQVLVRELPAEYSAEIQQHVTMKTVGREQIAGIDLVAMERLKFAFGVVGEDGDPLFNEDEAKEMAQKHGRAFKVVITAIDEISGLNEEELKQAEARFPSKREDEVRGAEGDGVAPRGARPNVPARAGVGNGQER